MNLPASAAGSPRTRLRQPILIEPGAIYDIATAAEDAIVAAGLPVFQRGGALVRPAAQQVVAAKGRTTVSACLVQMTQPMMLDALDQAVHWFRRDRHGKDGTGDPPPAVADRLLHRRGQWRFPHVAGVITTPTLRPDWTVLSEPGYDPATRLFLATDPALVMPQVPAYPTKAEAEAAITLLDGLLTGFPFVSDIDRAVALSALITPVVPGAMQVAPLHVMRASTAGSGKSFLVDLASAIATGRAAPVAAAGADPAETDKRIAGLLLSGAPLVSIDNVNGELGGDILCQAVERPTVRIRPLGVSTIAEIETRATIFATGNNLRVTGDMNRRTVVCDLDAETERPELRRFDFDPLERVLADRGSYVAAALTVVRAFAVCREREDILAALPPLGSYAEYTAAIRGALVWLGKADPVTSMEAARADDPVAEQLRAVMLGWWAEFNGKLAEPRMVRDILADAGTHPSTELGQALATVAGNVRGDVDHRRLGKWLAAHKGRIVTISPDGASGDMQCRFVSEAGRGGVARWRLDRL